MPTFNRGATKEQILAGEIYRRFGKDPLCLYLAGGGSYDSGLRLAANLRERGARADWVQLFPAPNSNKEAAKYHENEFRHVEYHSKLGSKAPIAIAYEDSLKSGKSLLGVVAWAIENAEERGIERIYTAAKRDTKNVTHFAGWRNTAIPYRPFVPGFMEEIAPKALAWLLKEAEETENWKPPTGLLSFLRRPTPPVNPLKLYQTEFRLTELSLPLSVLFGAGRF